ncbi:hypothetical protein QEZ54_28045 [Catellatospora sp. KI3]|uniref:hypothetical protein n=1 Tax=Catellatospora sp. KI3 TaxID=3041620 RepID=UPI0024826805|nr:hypothetical protein [Catellatospora sp. KI3]MDI1464828.1 hypothetical protein [Catellatospora sp. KI3]
MKRWGGKWDRWTVIALVVGLLLVAGLGVAAVLKEPASTAAAPKPAKVEALPGRTEKKIVLTEEGAARLGLQTQPVAAATAGKRAITTIPYSALMYLPDGSTWAYTPTDHPLAFVRHPVQVTAIQGDKVLLAQGPAAGTPVVTVGVAELYGAETGVGK